MCMYLPIARLSASPPACARPSASVLPAKVAARHGYSPYGDTPRSMPQYLPPTAAQMPNLPMFRFLPTSPSSSRRRDPPSLSVTRSTAGAGISQTTPWTARRQPAAPFRDTTPSTLPPSGAVLPSDRHRVTSTPVVDGGSVSAIHLPHLCNPTTQQKGRKAITTPHLKRAIRPPPPRPAGPELHKAVVRHAAVTKGARQAHRSRRTFRVLKP